MGQDLKGLSKQTWITENADQETIRTSALMRIADATEKLVANYDQLRTDKEWYEARCKSLIEELQQLKYSRAGYMAALTRLRNKIADEKNPVVTAPGSDN